MLKNKIQTNIAKNSVKFETTTRFLDESNIVTRTVCKAGIYYQVWIDRPSEYDVERCFRGKPFGLRGTDLGLGEMVVDLKCPQSLVEQMRSCQEEQDTKKVKEAFPETRLYKGHWSRSNHCYMIDSTRVSEVIDYDDEIKAVAYSVGYTDTIVFECYKIAPGQEKLKYSHVTTFDGKIYGKIGTYALPEHINELPIGEERFHEIEKYREREQNKAFSIIFNCFDFAQFGNADGTSIRLSIADDVDPYLDEEYDTAFVLGDTHVTKKELAHIEKQETKQQYTTLVVGGKETDVIQATPNFDKDLYKLIC